MLQHQRTYSFLTTLEDDAHPTWPMEWPEKDTEETDEIASRTSTRFTTSSLSSSSSRRGGTNAFKKPRLLPVHAWCISLLCGSERTVADATTRKDVSLVSMLANTLLLSETVASSYISTSFVDRRMYDSHEPEMKALDAWRKRKQREEREDDDYGAPHRDDNDDAESWWLSHSFPVLYPQIPLTYNIIAPSSLQGPLSHTIPDVLRRLSSSHHGMAGGASYSNYARSSAQDSRDLPFGIISLTRQLLRDPWKLWDTRGRNAVKVLSSSSRSSVKMSQTKEGKRHKEEENLLFLRLLLGLSAIQGVACIPRCIFEYFFRNDDDDDDGIPLVLVEYLIILALEDDATSFMKTIEIFAEVRGAPSMTGSVFSPSSCPMDRKRGLLQATAAMHCSEPFRTVLGKRSDCGDNRNSAVLETALASRLLSTACSAPRTHPEIVRTLVRDSGAPVTHPDRETLIHQAKEKYRQTTATTSGGAGATSSADKKKTNPKPKYPETPSPLILAVQKGSLPLIQALLEAEGAGTGDNRTIEDLEQLAATEATCKRVLNTVDTGSEFSPLHAACYWLREGGGGATVDAKKSSSSYSSIEIIKYLLYRGADPNLNLPILGTPLHCLAFSSQQVSPEVYRGVAELLLTWRGNAVEEGKQRQQTVGGAHQLNLSSADPNLTVAQYDFLDKIDSATAKATNSRRGSSTDNVNNGFQIIATLDTTAGGVRRGVGYSSSNQTKVLVTGPEEPRERFERMRRVLKAQDLTFLSTGGTSLETACKLPAGYQVSPQQQVLIETLLPQTNLLIPNPFDSLPLLFHVSNLDVLRLLLDKVITMQEAEVLDEHETTAVCLSDVLLHQVQEDDQHRGASLSFSSSSTTAAGGWTVLHHAAHNGQFARCRLLLNKFTESLARGRQRGRSSKEKEESPSAVEQQLLQLFVLCKDTKGRTAVDLAEENNHGSIVRLLKSFYSSNA